MEHKIERELIEFASCPAGHLTGSWSIPEGATQGYPLVVLATGDGPNATVKLGDSLFHYSTKKA